MRAVRDEDDFSDFNQARRRAATSRRERRLAYEIAMGIWLGGIALAATAAVFWSIAVALLVGTIRFG